MSRPPSPLPVASRFAVRARVEGSTLPGIERVFAEPFTIGRGMRATLHVDSARVSRLHVEIVIEDGRWLLRDANSTNGTYLGDERIEEVEVGEETVVRLGREGPTVRLALVDGVPSTPGMPPSETSRTSARRKEKTTKVSEPFQPGAAVQEPSPSLSEPFLPPSSGESPGTGEFPVAGQEQGPSTASPMRHGSASGPVPPSDSQSGGNALRTAVLLALAVAAAVFLFILL